MSATAILAGLQARRLARRPWAQVALAAGVALAVVAAGVAATHEGLAREDALRRGGATLLLLGGLAVAVVLGSARAQPRLRVGALRRPHRRRSRAPPARGGRRGPARRRLLVVLAAWGVALQIGSAALGLGLDGPLAVHTLAVAEGLVLALLACAAASSVVGPVAAGAFGLSLYVLAQAAVNLKAAADQALIGTADSGVRALYYVVPHTITSPMIADMQARDVAGAAAPRVEINHNIVLVPAAGWGSVVWTLAWCVLLVALCASGLRRRPLR